MKHTKEPVFQRKWKKVLSSYTYKPFFKHHPIIIPFVLPVAYKKVIKVILRYFNCVGLWHWYQGDGDITKGIKIYGETSNLKRVKKLINTLEDIENSIQVGKIRKAKSRAKHQKTLAGSPTYVQKVRSLRALSKLTPKEYASLTRKTTIEEIYNFIKLELKGNPDVDQTSSELNTLKEFYNKVIIKSNYFKHKTLIR